MRLQGLTRGDFFDESVHSIKGVSEAALAFVTFMIRIRVATGLGFGRGYPRITSSPGKAKVIVDRAVKKLQAKATELVADSPQLVLPMSSQAEQLVQNQIAAVGKQIQEWS